MIGRLIIRLFVIPLAIFLIVGGMCYYWYSTTRATYEERAEQYRRLQTAKELLVGLRARSPELRRLRVVFDKVNDPTVVDSARFWLSQNAVSNLGVELEQATVVNLTAIGTLPAFGSLSCRFSCRANGLSTYLSKGLNEFPNLMITSWSLDGNNPKKVLNFSATMVVVKLKP